MPQKNTYCTLDTETLQGITNPMLAYHIGGLIHDRQGNVLAPFNYLVAELFDQIRDDDYHKDHWLDYLSMVREGTATMVPTVADAVAAVESLLTYYGVTHVMAFNAGFDLFRGACAPLRDGREFIDLQLTALETLACKKSYAEFCRANGLRSKSGKCVATNVESYYAFITNDPTFEEKHTAFDDARVEMAIFLACMAAHKRFTKGVTFYDAEGFRRCPKW